MKFIALLFSLLLLSGCGQLSEDFTKAKAAEELKYTDPAQAENNATFKNSCVILTPKISEFVVGMVIPGEVTCPEDLKPFNKGFSDILYEIYHFWTLLVVFVFVTFITWVSGMALTESSARGVFLSRKFAYKFMIGISLAPIPSVGISTIFLAVAICGFFGIHTANITINYMETKDQLVKNISIAMPANTYLAPDTTNLIAWYNDVFSANQQRDIVINFEEQNDKLKANIIYKTSQLDFEMQLNPVAYQLSDEYGLGYGKDYQIAQLQKILTATFKDAELVARKINRARTMVLTTNDVNFNKMSCSETRAFDMSNVSEIVKQKYIIREGACLSESINYALNSVGESRKANLCTGSVVDIGTAESCVRAAYANGLYAGGVATEFYKYVKDQEEDKSLSIFTLPLLIFKGGIPDLTSNAGIFYNSINISYSTDVEKEDYSNGYKPTAFSIPLSNVANPEAGFDRKRAAFEKLEGIDGGTLTEANPQSLLKNILFGKDGFCGQGRYEYCSVRASENTEDYKCQSEILEDIIYGWSITQCGIAVKSLSFMKGLSKGSRNKAAEATASTSLFSIPNMMMGVRVLLPIGAVMGASEIGNAWTAPEMSIQSNEAYALIALTVINNKAVEGLLDSTANNAIIFGIFKVIVTPLTITLAIIGTVILIVSRYIANLFIIPVKLAMSVIDDGFDNTMDMMIWMRDLLISLVKPTLYVTTIFIANFCYSMMIFDVHSFADLSGNSIYTGEITLTSIIIILANILMQVGLTVICVKLTFGSYEAMNTNAQNNIINDEINDSLSAEEAESHTKQANNSAKDLKSKKKDNQQFD